MSEEQDNYRPKSPDLSGFVPPPRLSRLPSYHQTPTDSSFPPGFAFSPRGSYDASPYFSPQNSQPSNYFGSQPHVQPPPGFSPQLTRTPSVPTLSSPRQPTSHSQPRPPPPSFSTPSYTHTSPRRALFESPTSSQYQDMPRTRGSRSMGDDDDGDFDPRGSGPMKPAPTPINHVAAPPIMSGDNNPALTTDVKTKFPVARIKRIMQADEDIGKVAQATPTAVAKALELFMITLILGGATSAKNQNSKRVTAQHLKAAISSDKEFDFLNEICADIPDEDKGGSKKGKAKSEADSSDESMRGAPVAKKRKSSKRKGSEETD